MSTPAPEKPPPTSWRYRREDLGVFVRGWLGGVVLGAVLTVVVAGLWAIWSGDSFVGRLAPGGVVAACLVPMSNPMGVWHDTRISGLVGARSWSGRPGEAGDVGLTAVGLGLFVSLPMVVVASVAIA